MSGMTSRHGLDKAVLVGLAKVDGHDCVHRSRMRSRAGNRIAGAAVLDDFAICVWLALVIGLTTFPVPYREDNRCQS
jgi:hypothetical protein